MGRLLRAGPGFALCLFLAFLLQTVADRRTALYNRLMASYHKAKIKRANMAHELEDAKGEASSSTCFFLFGLAG
jgi:hypothetical protein